MYICQPNLPKGRVTVVAVSENALKAINRLEKMGIECIKIQSDGRLPNAIASHADVNTLFINNKCLLNNSQSLASKRIEELGFETGQTESIPGNIYPFDCLLNAAVIGSNIICKISTIDTAVKKEIIDLNLNVIDVNQGYAKCSTAVISEKAIITSDKAIAEKVKSFGIDSLYVSPVKIKLNGYSYGFFGGCSGMLSENLLGVCGDINSNQMYNEIIDYSKKYNVEIIPLYDGPLEDVGGILPITYIENTESAINNCV